MDAALVTDGLSLWLTLFPYLPNPAFSLARHPKVRWECTLALLLLVVIHCSAHQRYAVVVPPPTVTAAAACAHT